MSFPSYPLVLVRRTFSDEPTDRLSLDAVAERSAVHPELVVRFVELSLLEAEPDRTGRLSFAVTAPARVARIQRLRGGLSLNYASIGLVLDLLDRIDRLEAALRRNGLSPKE